LPHVELAQEHRIEVVAAIAPFQRKISKALVEVALDGAQVDAELLSQGGRFQTFTLVELDQNE